MASTAYTRTLSRAMETLGGPARLAVALRVTESKLALWLQGDEVPPMEVFAEALEIVARGPLRARAPQDSEPRKKA
jgi:hypothetical protein